MGTHQVVLRRKRRRRLLVQACSTGSVTLHRLPAKVDSVRKYNAPRTHAVLPPWLSVLWGQDASRLCRPALQFADGTSSLPGRFALRGARECRRRGCQQSWQRVRLHQTSLARSRAPVVACALAPCTRTGGANRSRKQSRPPRCCSHLCQSRPCSIKSTMRGTAACCAARSLSISGHEARRPPSATAAHRMKLQPLGRRSVQVHVQNHILDVGHLDGGTG